MMQIIMISESHADWKNNVNDVKYLGHKDGLLEGYNLEFQKDGKTDYASCIYIDEAPNYMNRDVALTLDMCGMNGWAPTGRAIFRGYYREEYDWAEHESYVEQVEVKE